MRQTAASLLRRLSSTSALPAAELSVRFCESCGYGKYATALAQELRRDGCTVSLDSGGGVGEYEVSASLPPGSPTVKLWSKAQCGEPSTPEAHGALIQFLKQELHALRRRRA